MTETDARQFITEILRMWTESDTRARRAAIESHFHEDARFYDPDGEFFGYEQLERFSDSLQRRFPGSRFTLVSPPQQLGNAIRAFWQLGPTDEPAAIKGMDFVIWDGARVKTLYAFVEVPVP
jgi:SnoaL-like domain